mgnify:FL=1
MEQTPLAVEAADELDFDQRVGSILEGLGRLSIEEAEKYVLMFHG